MRVLSGFLYRKLLCLSPHPGLLGMSLAKGFVINSCIRHQPHSCSKTSVVTAADLVNYWQEVFEKNEIPEPQASSEYIVSHVLGAKTFESLNTRNICTPVSSMQQEQIRQLCAKRLKRMPVQHVLGEWDFLDLTLKMNPPVFIPRPETEELVSLMVDEELRKKLTTECHKDPCLFPETNGPVILEVGCGSGAISLSLLKKLPHSRVIAIDRLEAAVKLTQENAERLQLQDRIKIFHHDLFSGPWEYLLPWGLIDTIISNPPYVFHEDIAHLAAEILSYEDLGALDGGEDGMSVIKEILNLSHYILKDCGNVFLEVEPRHPEMVTTWLHNHPNLFLSVFATHNDFCGKYLQEHRSKRQMQVFAIMGSLTSLTDPM